MEALIPRSLHPTPDRVREHWMSLNGEWEFSFDTPVFDRTITVPFSWAAPLSGIGEDHKGTGWYRKYVRYDCGDRRLFLHIGAVDYESDVFVNGVHLAHHFGGYTPVTAEVSQVWSNQNVNEIMIRAADYDYEYQTYGKQGYGNLRGIWQTVWLEARPEVYIEDFRITTLCSGEVTIEAEVVGGAGWMLTAEFGLADELASGLVGAAADRADAKAQADETVRISAWAQADGSSEKCRLVLEVPKPKLWSPENPYLYEGTLSLTSANGAVVDKVHTYFGIREIGTARVDERKRKYITLNGKPVYINGCLDQSYNPGGYFTLPEDEECRAEIQQMKDLGLNCARIHMKPEDPRKLYWADKLGLLIMEDIPCFWGEPTSVAKAFYEPQMMEVLKRDKNHPSIFYWVVFNETWGLLDFVKQPDGTVEKVYTERTQKWVVDCYKKVKAYDPTRLVEDNSPCRQDHTVTDVNTWHFYANGYENTKKSIVDYVETSNVGDRFNFIGEYACTDIPLMNSECGNVWGLDGNAGDSDISWHYKYMMNEFRLHDEVNGFIFTEFRDVINEFNGYYRIDDSKKEFGYAGYVPGMTVRDLHSYDFLAVDCEPMKTCRPGETVVIPMVLSSFEERHHGEKMSVVWELVLETGLWDRQEKDGQKKAVVSCGEIPVEYHHYGCSRLEPLTVKLPKEKGIAKLRFYLKDSAGNCVMRNFLVYDIQTSADTASFEESKEPGEFTCTGFKRAWCVQQGNKLNCVGAGTASVTVKKTKIKGYEPGKAVCITFEASSKQELTKDILADESGNGAAENSQDMDFMRGYRVDRGKNPNSYFQTDEERYPETITVWAGTDPAQCIGEFYLPDAPADSRGCLSWHYQPEVRKNQEAGSYGYLCRAVISAELAEQLPEVFQISIKGNVGFSIYGRNSGRYPIGFEVNAE